ncbi:hypothetical protein AUP41_17870 [Thalassospira xiamenensis]|nr:hypothetical protein AUP41_17870 [Thalassospira xiamenensis]
MLVPAVQIFALVIPAKTCGAVPVKVFYSWQSDYMPKTNQHFLRDVLKKAVEVVAQDYSHLELEERPKLDHDTQDVSGAVDITRTIFEKIEASAAFIVDVTPVGKTDNGNKALPNPNALFEFGWALSKHGDSRMVMILNLASGFTANDLPFDIRQRRIFTYDLPPSATQSQRKKQEEQLVPEMARIISGILKQQTIYALPDAVFQKVPAAANNPSIWDGCGSEIQHWGSLSGKEVVSLIDAPRAWLRVVPRSWRTAKPRVGEMMQASLQNRVDAPSIGYRSGNFGINYFGFVSYWMIDAERGVKTKTDALSQWFEETGEYWVLWGAPFTKNNDSYSFASHAFCRFKDTLKDSIRFYHQSGASAELWVQMGLFGARDTEWRDDFSFSPSYYGRTNVICYEEHAKNWTEDLQMKFMLNMFNEICSKYGRSTLNMTEFVAFLRS